MSATSRKSMLQLLVVLVVLLAVAVHATTTEDGGHLRKQQKQAKPRRNKNKNNKIHPKNRNLAQTRIVGGSEVKIPNKYPFFGEWEEGCGGSLIHDDIYLTAAHCEATDAPFKKLIWFNSMDSGHVVRDTGVIRSAVHYQSHPGYHDYHMDHDVMVIKLDSSALVDPITGQPTTAKTIDINFDPTIPKDDAPLYILGTGLTEENGDPSDTLQEATVFYAPHSVCHDQYGVDYAAELMMCAGVPGGGIDNCQGDSGSPIVDASSGLQVGVDSWGNGCARADGYGVKARVSADAEWMYEQVCWFSSYPPEDCAERGYDVNPMPNMPTTGPGSIAVTIGHDRYPLETAWFLQHVDSHTELYFQPFESEQVNEETAVEKTFDNLPAGSYHFALGDDEDDGTCCDHGQEGSTLVDATTGKQVWSHNGDFGAQIHVFFDILDNGQVANLRESTTYQASWEQVPNHAFYREPTWPGEHPTDPRFGMAVNIYYDMWPKEVDWQLEYQTVGANGKATWEPIHTVLGEDLDPETTASRLITTQLPGLKTGWYRFSIRDTEKDGICCDHRYGWATVTAALKRKNGDPGVAWYTDGEFLDGVDIYMRMNPNGIVNAVSWNRPETITMIRQRNGGQRNLLKDGITKVV